MLSGSCMNPRTAGVSAALGFTLLQGILLTDDVLITCRQCQRPPLECVRCLRPSLQSQGRAPPHTHACACHCQHPTLEGEASPCAATALTRGPMPSRCKLPTVAGADRSLQGTTARRQPQCRRLLAAAICCGRVVNERERERWFGLQTPRCDRQGGTRTCRVAPCH